MSKCLVLQLSELTGIPMIAEDFFVSGCFGLQGNADKCGVMHNKRNGVKRTTSIFSVGGDRVKVVVSYKYRDA